jgi:hypothetical protein
LCVISHAESQAPSIWPPANVFSPARIGGAGAPNRRAAGNSDADWPDAPLFFRLSRMADRTQPARVETLAHFLLIAALASIFQERRNLTVAAFLVAVLFTALTLRLHITESLPLNF